MVNCLFLWRVDGFFSELSVSISPFNCSSSLLSCHSPMRWKFSEKMRVLCTEHSCYQKPGHTGRGTGHCILVWNAKMTNVENVWFSFWCVPVRTKQSQLIVVFNLTYLLFFRNNPCWDLYSHSQTTGKTPKAWALPRFWVWIRKQPVKNMK